MRLEAPPPVAAPPRPRGQPIRRRRSGGVSRPGPRPGPGRVGGVSGAWPATEGRVRGRSLGVPERAGACPPRWWACRGRGLGVSALGRPGPAAGRGAGRRRRAWAGDAAAPRRGQRAAAGAEAAASARPGPALRRPPPSALARRSIGPAGPRCPGTGGHAPRGVPRSRVGDPERAADREGARSCARPVGVAGAPRGPGRGLRGEWGAHGAPGRPHPHPSRRTPRPSPDCPAGAGQGAKVETRVAPRAPCTSGLSKEAPPRHLQDTKGPPQLGGQSWFTSPCTSPLRPPPGQTLLPPKSPYSCPPPARPRGEPKSSASPDPLLSPHPENATWVLLSHSPVGKGDPRLPRHGAF